MTTANEITMIVASRFASSGCIAQQEGGEGRLRRRRQRRERARDADARRDGASCRDTQVLGGGGGGAQRRPQNQMHAKMSPAPQVHLKVKVFFGPRRSRRSRATSESAVIIVLRTVSE